MGHVLRSRPLISWSFSGPDVPVTLLLGAEDWYRKSCQQLSRGTPLNRSDTTRTVTTRDSPSARAGAREDARALPHSGTMLTSRDAVRKAVLSLCAEQWVQRDVTGTTSTRLPSYPNCAATAEAWRATPVQRHRVDAIGERVRPSPQKVLMLRSSRQPAPPRPRWSRKAADQSRRSAGME
jgi:hypothetical protein